MGGWIGGCGHGSVGGCKLLQWYFWPPLFTTPPKPRSFYHRHHCLPGTGKTDTAVQIMHILYHNCPNQRTLVVTHSNQALNDLFAKVCGGQAGGRVGGRAEGGCVRG